ncbi:MAG: hypothetical protein R6V12_18980 [Candidatus Hydrogenedentota bacterium]
MRRKLRTLNIAILAGLCLIAIELTVVLFYISISPANRGTPFFAALIACCVAEAVFFLYLGFSMNLLSAPDASDAPIRMQVSTVVILWMLVIIVTSIIGVVPGISDSFYARNLTLIQFIITFFFGGAALFFHRQGLVLADMDRAPQTERQYLASFTQDMDQLDNELRQLAGKCPEHAVQIESLQKRIDIISTQLSSASPDRPHGTWRATDPANSTLIQTRLHELSTVLAGLGPDTDDDDLNAAIERAGNAAENVLSALRQRESAITS